MRQWVDDTGDWKIEARLVQILDGKVRLLKSTGKFTTVPLDRLSSTDLDYVHEQVAAAAADRTDQTAQR